MKRNESATASGKDAKKSPILCHVTKRSIVAGTSQRSDGVAVTIQGPGLLSTDDLALDIQKTCSLTRGDVLHVIAELQGAIVRALKQGQMVSLNKIGTFDISIGTAKPMYAEQHVYDSDIVVKGITFRASDSLKAELKDIKFKVATDTRAIVSERDTIPLVRSWFEEHDVITLQNLATLCHCSFSTARRRLKKLLDTHRLERLPHSTIAYIPGVNLHSTSRP